MTAPGLTYDACRALQPCDASFRRVSRRLGGKKGWDGNLVTAAQAKDAGVRFADIVWVASVVAQTNPDVKRRLRLWMADCAARVLHIYEREVPGDARVRDAIVAARRFSRGEIDDAAWAAAWAAARAARAMAAEEEWQFSRLVAWLSDPEPDDLRVYADPDEDYVPGVDEMLGRLSDNRAQISELQAELEQLNAQAVKEAQS